MTHMYWCCWLKDISIQCNKIVSNSNDVLVGQMLESHLMSYKRKSNINKGGSVTFYQTFICGLGIGLVWLSQNTHLWMYSPTQVNTPNACWRFLSISSRGKNENKKPYTIEIEGAMVKRQLQTWINCIMNSVVNLFPASMPQWVRFG